jgi:hypothetical protein
MSGGGVTFVSGGALTVRDSIFRDNHVAVTVFPASGTAQAQVDNVRMEGRDVGLAAGDGSKVTVRNSVASNTGIGFLATSSTSASSELNYRKLRFVQ